MEAADCAMMEWRVASYKTKRRAWPPSRLPHGAHAWSLPAGLGRGVVGFGGLAAYVATSCVSKGLSRLCDGLLEVRALERFPMLGLQRSRLPVDTDLRAMCRQYLRLETNRREVSRPQVPTTTLHDYLFMLEIKLWGRSVFVDVAQVDPRGRPGGSDLVVIPSAASSALLQAAKSAAFEQSKSNYISIGLSDIIFGLSARLACAKQGGAREVALLYHSDYAHSDNRYSTGRYDGRYDPYFGTLPIDNTRAIIHRDGRVPFLSVHYTHDRFRIMFSMQHHSAEGFNSRYPPQVRYAHPAASANTRMQLKLVFPASGSLTKAPKSLQVNRRCITGPLENYSRRIKALPIAQ